MTTTYLNHLPFFYYIKNSSSYRTVILDIKVQFHVACCTAVSCNPDQDNRTFHNL